MASKKKKSEEITVELPDLGLTARQLAQLSKAFQNDLVATLGTQEAVDPVRKMVIKAQKRAAT